MIILGLTGSIGMGKSTVAGMFRYLGVPVHDADAVVHDLMKPGGAAFDAIAKNFPGAVQAGRVDRKILGGLVFGNAPELAKLEAILHPLVQACEKDFLRRQRRVGRRLVVLDIPLLFETGGESRCDYVAVVSAPAFVQRQRVLARPGMKDETFRQILQKQMPDRDKRRRADFIIPTGLGRAVTFGYIRSIVTALGKRNHHA